MSRNLSSTTPAPPGGNTNVTWQADANGNVSGYVPTGGGGGSAISIEDTLFNILNSHSPTAGTLAWATDYNVFLAGNGTNWYVDSSYLVKKPAKDDMGYLTYSNREGYGSAYITNKILANCQIGGAPGVAAVGALRFNHATNNIEVYDNSNAWRTVADGFAFQAIAADGYAFEHLTSGFTWWIQTHSGNSDVVGLNGIPLARGYKVCMGAFPFPPNISGGSF